MNKVHKSIGGKEIKFQSAQVTVIDPVALKHQERVDRLKKFVEDYSIAQMGTGHIIIDERPFGGEVVIHLSPEPALEHVFTVSISNDMDQPGCFWVSTEFLFTKKEFELQAGFCTKEMPQKYETLRKKYSEGCINLEIEKRRLAEFMKCANEGTGYFQGLKAGDVGIKSYEEILGYHDFHIVPGPTHDAGGHMKLLLLLLVDWAKEAFENGEFDDEEMYQA
tara:strand:- start:1196 stop:1858 length:663 start_codon:yes stop_codon:yes gene_type:complete